MNLILNADDFGFSLSTNEAIFELAYLGSLNSTTVMVNMPFWQDINKLVSLEKFGIGLHFNLTQGASISPPLEVPSLINPLTNEFYSYGEFKKRCSKKLIDPIHVEKELNAQFNLLYSQIGDRLTHIDSHQAIHKINLISNVVYRFGKASAFKIGLRSPHHYFITKKNQIIQASLSSISRFKVKRVLTEYYYRWFNIKFKNHFLMPHGELLHIDLKKISTLKSILDLGSSNPITLEISCHPATRVDDLPSTKLIHKRVEEYQILKSELMIEALKKFNLVTFKEIKN